mmetsp:Transcript_47723/g.102258  ORF Transcript_47723/g.102258 Transcript_47723/m.102258 type:complete len:130 (+) Transcript_47723:77-466(+)
MLNPKQKQRGQQLLLLLPFRLRRCTHTRTTNAHSHTQKQMYVDSIARLGTASVSLLRKQGLRFHRSQHTLQEPHAIPRFTKSALYLSLKPSIRDFRSSVSKVWVPLEAAALTRFMKSASASCRFLSSSW